MSVCDLDVKDIYEIGQNLKNKLADEETRFSGEKLVDWFIQNERQVQTREEAVRLGRYFIEYRVIQHEQDKYHFIDDTTKIYRFCCHSQNIHPRSESERQTWVQGLEVMRQYVQEHGPAKKRKQSFMSLLSKGQQNTNIFKGKHLIEWLEKKTDFESREDCKRFFKSLLKLNFVRSSQNDLRFNESGEYWFYLTRLKDDSVPKTRKISKVTKIPEQKTSAAELKICGDIKLNSLNRQQSIIGLTPSLIRQLAVHQTCSSKPIDRIKLKDTCGVLRSSLTRSSQCLSQSRSSIGQTSLGNSRSSLASSQGDNTDRYSVASGESTDSDQGHYRRSYTENCRRTYTDHVDNNYIARLRAQYSNNKSRLTQSECGSVSDLIESKDFQKQLEKIGKSSSEKNLKQVEVSRREILAQLKDIKFGSRSKVISPSSSCPQNLHVAISPSKSNSYLQHLDLFLKRDYSTESRATRSSGYGSIRDQSYTSSRDDLCSSNDSLFERDCSTPTSPQPGPSRLPGVCATSRLDATSDTSSTASPPADSPCSASPPADSLRTPSRVRFEPHSPVPPPRSSLIRDSLTVPALKPDGRLQESVERSLRTLMTSHGPQKTATSARRARLVRSRAVSEGDAN